MKYLPSLLAFITAFFHPERACTQSFDLGGATTRAVVIGISAQQDSLLPDLPANRQHAEMYAAFLRSRSGGQLPADHVQLLTGEQATMAAFTAAIAWLDEESVSGDRIVLYFAGNARLQATEVGPKPHLFFFDSPLALAGSGSISLPKLYYLMHVFSVKKNLRFDLVLDLYTEAKTAAEDDVWQRWLETIRLAPAFGWWGETLMQSQKRQNTKGGFSPILLDGLLGHADKNGDGRIKPKELGRYLNSHQNKVASGYAGLLAVSDETWPLAMVDESKAALRASENNTSQFPAIISQELSRKEDSLLAISDDCTRQWYLDFILTMKLGQLMAPAGHCTSDLYDSLLTKESIKPLHSHLRRQLAAALQDETQQALNDYLRTDTRELKRRWKHADNYADYPRYMARVVELLGDKHFMYPLVQCKKYYFEGLSWRLNFETNQDSALLNDAVEAQQRALQYEPEAAFVMNEMGILYFFLNRDSAQSYYLQAISFAPQWSIPYHNLAVWHRRNGQLDSALNYAGQAVDLAPWNPVSVATLGSLYLQTKHYSEAGEWLKRASFLDPTNSIIYYDLSCTEVEQGKINLAFGWLELAFLNGFGDIGYLEKDEDLMPLFALPAWKELKKKYFPDEARD